MASMSEAAPPVPAAADPLERGRAALKRHDWPTAFEQLGLADADGRSRRRRTSSRWPSPPSSPPRPTSNSRSRSARSRPTRPRATSSAPRTSRSTSRGRTGSWARARSRRRWTHRAERIIGPEGETYAHGYLALVRSEAAARHGRHRGGARPRGTGRGDRDARGRRGPQGLRPDATSARSRSPAASTIDGFAMMEEASIAAVNGELSPFTTGVTACRMIGACRDMTDYRRASEWIEATERYCDRQSLVRLPRRVPDPPGRGRRGRRRLGPRGAGARTRDDRAGAVQRDAAPGRRVLRDR